MLMNGDASKAALERELLQLEADLADLRRTAADLRQQIGDGPGDAVDISTTITEAEEQEALAEELEVRRDELRRRLGLQ
jgi:signal transduction histidine kinase